MLVRKGQGRLETRGINTGPSKMSHGRSARHPATEDRTGGQHRPEPAQTHGSASGAALAWDENRPRAQRLLRGLPGTAAGPQGDPEGLPGEPYGSAYVRAPHSEVLTELIQAEAWASLRFSRASSWF
uniref:Uncharacterized protein n=1 Tax=Rousettus aegyptiacus TaxID=9407 RepID=A0A7J8HSN5_ROUAE|nr:hypothetical protein HJG63_010892 [Rousettus aegyptiacus]